MNYYKWSSALDTIKKRKISIILDDPNNKACFECSSINPEFISINNGIFLCNNCVKNHLKLPKAISTIIQNGLNNLSMKNVQYLSYGGNKNLKEYIYNNFPDLIYLSPDKLYKTYALDYYRKMIEYLVEGGIKPVKPDINIAYELVEINDKENNMEQYKEINYQNKNRKLIRKIKSDSFIKYRNSPYPKIKPIIGSNTESRLTKFSNSKNNSNKLSQTVANLNNNIFINPLEENHNNYKTHNKINSYSIDNTRTFYPNFGNNYDNDDDFNNLTYVKGTIYEYNNSSTHNKNAKIREKILKGNEMNNILNTNPIIKNKNNNNIYAKYMSQNYLNIYDNNRNGRNLYANDNTYNKTYNTNKINNTTVFNYDRRKKINNKELRSFLQNKYKEKENYIFNLKLNSAKPTLINGLNEEEIRDIKNNANINNINNNIIINRNLNVFYNNNNNYKKNSRTIFKKKPIGNSFSFNSIKINSIHDKQYSSDNSNFFSNTNNSENIITQKNQNKTIIERNDNYNLIKVNKIKTISNSNQGIKINNEIFNNKNNSPENMQITVKRNKKNNQNNDDNLNMKKEGNQESMIIQRISRVIKIQKERQKKMEMINKTTDLNKNNDKFKFKILNIEKVDKRKKEKEKENLKLNKKNNAKEIKIKIYKKYDKTSSNKYIVEPRKTNHTLMRELNNLPSGKKKNILEIIKTNILSNKSLTSGVQKILKIDQNKK